MDSPARRKKVILPVRPRPDVEYTAEQLVVYAYDHSTQRVYRYTDSRCRWMHLMYASGGTGCRTAIPRTDPRVLAVRAWMPVLPGVEVEVRPC